MSARTVAVRLTADVQGYVQGMRNAAAATKDLTNSTLDTAAKNKQAFQTVGVAAGAMGLAAAAGVGLAVKTFADFDAAMSGVQAATHESASGMQLLRDAAIEAGARTAFSATEAADGIEQLAKAGVSTAAILNGGLNGALDLAAAGGLEVGAAAEIAATAMTQFALDGSKVPHVADLLAAAAGRAQGDVSDMGMALKQAGLVASQTGLTIEETTAGLASFAAAGLLGSDAGTSMKSMLQRLTPQSAEAAGKMDELGISAYDAQGNFIGLEAFAENLKTSLSGLTVEQRNSAMATIFGSDAVRAASVLYKQGGEGIADWTAKVNDAGYAQETAAIKLDNLKGDLEAFSGSVETALIKTGAAGDGMARSLVQSATSVVNAYGDLPDTAQQTALGIGSVVAVAGGAASAFLVLAPRIADTRDALKTLSTEMPRTTTAMQGLGKAAAIGTVIVGTAIAIDQLQRALADAPPGVNAVTDSLADFIKTGRATGDLARIVGKDFEDIGGKVKRAGDSRIWEFLSPTEDDKQRIIAARDELTSLDSALAGLIGGGNAQEAREAFTSIAQAAREQGVSVDELKQRFPAYYEALAGISATTKLAADSQGEMGAATGAATGEVVEQSQSLSDLMEQVQSLSNQVLGLRGSEREFQAALDAVTESGKKHGQTLDINTEAGRNNEAALDAVATSANAVLTAMVESGAPIEDVTGKMHQQREALVNAAIGFGMTREQAQAYAESVLRVPTAVSTTATFNGYQAAVAIANHLEALGRIPRSISTSVFISEIRRDAAAAARGPMQRATGGWISGPGTGTSDSIPARLSNGEFVVNARSAGENAALLEAINNGRRFADGGWVSGRSGGSSPASAMTVELDASDRALLRAAINRPVQLNVDGHRLATTVNDHNHQSGRR